MPRTVTGWPASGVAAPAALHRRRSRASASRRRRLGSAGSGGDGAAAVDRSLAWRAPGRPTPARRSPGRRCGRATGRRARCRPRSRRCRCSSGRQRARWWRSGRPRRRGTPGRLRCPTRATPSGAPFWMPFGRVVDDRHGRRVRGGGHRRERVGVVRRHRCCRCRARRDRPGRGRAGRQLDLDELAGVGAGVVVVDLRDERAWSAARPGDGGQSDRRPRRPARVPRAARRARTRGPPGRTSTRDVLPGTDEGGRGAHGCATEGRDGRGPPPAGRDGPFGRATAGR